MSSERRHGAMDERPESVDSSREEGGIFIVGRHDDAESLEGAEVFRERERHAGTAARIGRERDGIFLEFRHVGDARVFDAPHFFGIVLGIGQERGFGIDLPAVHAVHRARSAQMREAAAIFHAAEEQSGSIGQKRGARR